MLGRIVGALTRMMSTVPSPGIAHPAVQSFIEKVSTKDLHTELANLVMDIREKMGELDQLAVMTESADLKELAEKDIENITMELNDLQRKFYSHAVDPEPMDYSESMVLEVAAGVGGQEAMLFADELFTMYSNFAAFNGWETEILSYDSENGCTRHASTLITGKLPYRTFKYEAGVHRVQRVPKTEKSGRIHTSTVSVAVLPTPQSTDLVINPNDLKIETKRASGAGGQHVNKTESAIRITHLPTNIIVECQQERSQIKNRSLAMKALVAKLYERESQEKMKTMTDLRKLQVGIVDRSRKIRTFNFVQDRVTDHRIAHSCFDLKAVLEGREELHKFVMKLVEYDQIEKVIQFCTKRQPN